VPLFCTIAAKVCVLPAVAEFGKVTLVTTKSGEVWAGGLTVRLAVWDDGPRFAVMVIVSLAVTALVVTINPTADVPAARLTLAGTLAALPLLCRATTAPPDGAGLDSRTTPTALNPPMTVVGDNERLDRETGTGFIVSDAVWEAPLYVAVTVTVWLDVTELVATMKVTEAKPAGIVTEVGTEAEFPLLRNVATAPPLGAGPDSCIVPVTIAPPVIAELDNVRLLSTATGAVAATEISRPDWAETPPALTERG